MPAIHYLAEADRLKMKEVLWPILIKMSKRELQIALSYVLYGVDIYEAFESARFTIEDKDKNR